MTLTPHSGAYAIPTFQTLYPLANNGGEAIYPKQIDTHPGHNNLQISRVQLHGVVELVSFVKCYRKRER